MISAMLQAADSKTETKLPNVAASSLHLSAYCNIIAYVTKILYMQQTTITTASVLQPLYRTTCISRHLQLRTGGFCWGKVLPPIYPC